jgi:hypothetical protein
MREQTRSSRDCGLPALTWDYATVVSAGIGPRMVSLRSSLVVSLGLVCRHAPAETDLSLIRRDARGLAKLSDCLGRYSCDPRDLDLRYGALAKGVHDRVSFFRFCREPGRVCVHETFLVSVHSTTIAQLNCAGNLGKYSVQPPGTSCQPGNQSLRARHASSSRSQVPARTSTARSRRVRPASAKDWSPCSQRRSLSQA